MENPGKETYVEQMERVNQTNPFMLHNRIRAVALSEDRAEVIHIGRLSYAYSQRTRNYAFGGSDR